MSAERPHVSVVLPVYNEEAFLDSCVRSLLDGSYPTELLEVLIADGGSDDGTVEVATRLADDLGAIEVMDNPGKLQASGFNVALAAADPQSTYIVRCDAHAEYPPGFLSRVIEVAERTDAELVVYSDEVRGKTCFQRGVAFAQSTPVGVGDSEYRLAGRSMWVDHGKQGCFRRADLDRVGGYDDALVSNEDFDLSERIRRAGGRIWLDEDVVVVYYPRASVRTLARQYWRYGQGRAATSLKHRVTPKPRQLAPIVLVAANSALLAAAPARPRALAPLGFYLGAMAATAIYGAVTRRDPCVLTSAAAFPVMHHAWGAGFIGRRLSAHLGGN